MTYSANKVLRIEAALRLSHQYPLVLFPGISLICVLEHCEIESVRIFHVAVGKLDCEKKKHEKKELVAGIGTFTLHFTYV